MPLSVSVSFRRSAGTWNGISEKEASFRFSAMIRSVVIPPNSSAFITKAGSLIRSKGSSCP
ncbi:hypothetical protein D3C86_2249800 [compost metagenome]